MSLDTLTQGVLSLTEIGWEIELEETLGKAPDLFYKRYNWVPQEVVHFLGLLKTAHNLSDTAWLQGFRDFADSSDSEFRWNEWEMQSLDAAEEDINCKQEISRFWDSHLPLMMSVSDGYSFIAIQEKTHYLVVGRNRNMKTQSRLPMNWKVSSSLCVKRARH